MEVVAKSAEVLTLSTSEGMESEDVLVAGDRWPGWNLRRATSRNLGFHLKSVLLKSVISDTLSRVYFLLINLLWVNSAQLRQAASSFQAWHF